MLSRTLTCVLLVAALPVAAAAAQAAAAGVRVNGVHFEVRTLVLPGEPDVLARHLDGAWGERQLLRSSADRARAALGRQRGPFHETLTLSPGPQPRTTRIVVAVQDLREPPAPLPAAPLPLPSAARVVNVVQFAERGEAAATFTIDLSGAPRGTLERLGRAAEARGWQRVASPAAVDARGSAFWAQRGVEELTVVALPVAARTRIVMLVASRPVESRPSTNRSLELRR